MKISVLFSLQMCNICKGVQLSDVLALRIKREVICVVEIIMMVGSSD